MLGLPYLGRSSEIPTLETKDIFLRNCVFRLCSSLIFLRIHRPLAQTPSSEFPLHPFNAGDWVLMHTWKESKLWPEWEGPFQIPLTAETAVRTAEKGWTHYARVKASINPNTYRRLTEDQNQKEGFVIDSGYRLIIVNQHIII